MSFMKSGQELHAVPGYLRVNEFHSNEDVEYLFFFLIHNFLYLILVQLLAL